MVRIEISSGYADWMKIISNNQLLQLDTNRLFRKCTISFNHFLQTISSGCKYFYVEILLHAIIQLTDCLDFFFTLVIQIFFHDPVKTSEENKKYNRYQYIQNLTVSFCSCKRFHNSLWFHIRIKVAWRASLY